MSLPHHVRADIHRVSRQRQPRKGWTSDALHAAYRENCGAADSWFHDYGFATAHAAFLTVLHFKRIAHGAGKVRSRFVPVLVGATAAAAAAATAAVAAAAAGAPVGNEQYMLVNTVAGAARMVAQARLSPAVAIDIEGDLTARGRLSLIQVAYGAPQAPTVAIVDALRCPAAVRGPLRELLEGAPSVQKVLHDCRNDSVALAGQFGIVLQNVLDTQVAHAELSGEPRRAGLNVVLERYAGGAQNTRKAEVRHRRGLWDSRPLAPHLLDYAAQDVRHLLLAREPLLRLAGEQGKLEAIVAGSRSNAATGAHFARPAAVSAIAHTASAFHEHLLRANDARMAECEDRSAFDAHFIRWKQAEGAKGQVYRGGAGMTLHEMKRQQWVDVKDSGSLILFAAKNNSGSRNIGPRRRVAREQVRSQRAVIEADRQGIAIRGGASFAGVIALGTVERRALAIYNQSACPIAIEQVEFQGSHSNTFRNAGQGALPQPGLLHIQPGGELALTVECAPAGHGMFRSLMLIKFRPLPPVPAAAGGGDGEAEAAATFEIGRYLEARCGNAEVLELLKPTAAYTRKRRLHTRRAPPSAVEDGERPVFGGARFKPRLRFYDIDPGWAHTCKLGEAAEKLEPQNRVLSATNYKEHFQRLLWCEELQQRADILSFDMPGATLTRAGPFLALKVPGLAEKRPSVLRGDHVLATKAGDDSRAFKGYAHQIENESVLLKFSAGFHRSYVSGMRVDVQFTVGRMCMRIFHQGVCFAQERLPPELLFPRALPGGGPRVRPTSHQIPPEAFSRGGLNDEQAAAVQQIVDFRAAPLPYVIFGPPGTGKTTTIIAAAKAILAAYPDERILMVAPSNSAADLLVEKMAQPPHAVPPDHMSRVNAFSRDRRTVSEEVMRYSHAVEESFALPPMGELEQRRVVVATLTMAGKLYNNGMTCGHFSTIFVDEAGHALEPEALCAVSALLAVSPGDRQRQGRLVLSGDPHQLGPIVMSGVAKECGLARSVLERLVELPLYSSAASPQVITKLVQNYRSHPDILAVPNERFYDGDLRACANHDISHVLCDWEHLPTRGCPLVFHGVVGKDMREGNSPSWFNPDEAATVLDYVTKLTRGTRANRVHPSEIGIISPYSKQVQKLRLLLKQANNALGGELDQIKVASTELFQGQERKVIIISTVRSSDEFVTFDVKHNLGFLVNPKRFNVAITRAQALLIVVGNPRVLSDDVNWKALIKHFFERGACTGVLPEPETEMDDAGIDELCARVGRMTITGPSFTERMRSVLSRTGEGIGALLWGSKADGGEMADEQRLQDGGMARPEE